MQLEISAEFIMFLYLVFVAVGVVCTGVGATTCIIDNDDAGKPELIFGVSILVVAIAALIVGIETEFVQITIKD